MKTILKEYIGPLKLLRDSFSLARKIYDSGFRPEVILSVWRGGASVGMAIHEFLAYMGVKTRQFPIKATSYTGINRRSGTKIEHLDTLAGNIKSHQPVLIVDDISETGLTFKAIKRKLSKRTDNMKTASLYLKTRPGAQGTAPDFHLKKTSRWIVFPHELEGLSPSEIKKKDKFIHVLISASHRLKQQKTLRTNHGR